MMYTTLEGVKRKITESLYDDETVDDVITATDVDTISWINTAVGATSDFTELELSDSSSILRLAADCYSACRILSEQLESHNVDQESLARFRCKEAREYVEMYCTNHGIVPAFDGESYIPVGAEYAYATGSDELCIG